MYIPKKYQKFFKKLEREEDLIDDCKYMLWYADGYAWLGEYPILPVKTQKEALQYLKEAEEERKYTNE